MNMQNVAKLDIPEGDVRTIHDKDGNLIWGRASYSVKHKGDTAQQTYTGKNKYKITEPSSADKHGLTVSVNQDTGAITYSGTTTSSYPWLSDNANMSLPAGTYTFSIGSPISYNLSLRIYRQDSTYPTGIYIPAGSTSYTFTTNFDSPRVVILLGVSTSGQTVPNTTIYPQIEVGSSATPFEPYVGGTASPNPDYPQPVQTVTGENVVKITGKNIFDKDTIFPLMSQSHSGGTVSYLGGGFSIKATSSDAFSPAVYGGARKRADGLYIPVKKNTTYTLSYKTSTNNGIKVLLYYYNGTNHTNIGSTITSNQATFTTGNYENVIIRFGNTVNGSTLVYSDIQLELGSTATAYEPYRGQSYEVNLGKNLFDKNNYSDQTGYYIGSNGIWRSERASDHYFVFRVEPNTTYTFSKNAQASNNRFRVGISSGAPTVGAAFPIWGGSDTATEITLTTASDSKYAYVYYSVTVNVQEAIQSLQIEVGSQKTDYAAYFAPIELCKIGTYQDYIWKDGNTWKVHKAVTKATYDGSENWAISNSGTANYYYRVASGIITPSDTTNCLSNYETARQVLNSNTVNGIWKLAGGQIRIRSGQELSLADWKSKLASKPLDFYVALATPTDTEITNEALVGQLGAVEQWLTRYGYDATVTGNLPIIIDRTAL